MRRITALKMVDKRKQMVVVELDGVAWRDVDLEVVSRMRLKVGDTLSPQQQSQIDRENEFVAARRRAVNFCVIQPRTQRQVERLLQRKHCKPDTINRVMEELLRQHLLRDRDVARRGVRRAERSKTGPQKTRAELEAAGVEEGLIDEELAEQQDPEWQRKQVAELLAKRMQKIEGNPAPSERRKLADYLLRRGFDWDIVREGIEKAVQSGTEDEDE